MAMLGKIRPLFYQDSVPINEIARCTSLSRNTIKKWLKPCGAAAPKFGVVRGRPR